MAVTIKDVAAAAGVPFHSLAHLQGQPFHQSGNQGTGAPRHGTAGLSAEP